MAGFQELTLIGVAGKDAEMTYTSNGTAVTKFSVAVSEYAGKDKQTGESNFNTTWFNIVCWDKLAESSAQYVVKGIHLFLKGRLQIQQYEDKQGIKRTSVNVVASLVRPVGKKQETHSTGEDTFDDLGDLGNTPF